MSLNQILSKNYKLFLSYASFLRVILVVALVIASLLYGNFLQGAQNPLGQLTGLTGNLYGIHLWGVVLWSGVIAYCFSLLMDIYVVLSKNDAVKSRLAKEARFFRIITYFYVGVTLANFAYRSYLTVGFNLPLHALLSTTLVSIVVLILFHAYQCREGLIFGGASSGKTKR